MITSLGIDPGLASCGLAIVTAGPNTRPVLLVAETFHTKPESEDRLERVASWLAGWITGYTFRGAHVGVENVEVRRQEGRKIDPNGMLMTARVVGVVVGLCVGRQPALVCRASDWRRSIGAGHGTPAEVRRAVELHVGPVKGSVHACDAVGIALHTLNAARSAAA